jgi:hypothetical protein
MIATGSKEGKNLKAIATAGAKGAAKGLLYFGIELIIDEIIDIIIDAFVKWKPPWETELSKGNWWYLALYGTNPYIVTAYYHR